MHEVEHSRRRDGWQEQRRKGVEHVHPVHKAEEAQRRHLGWHGHDEKDEDKSRFLQLEIVGIEAVGGQAGEIGGQQRRHAGDDQAVHKSGLHGNVGVIHDVLKVPDQRGAGQSGEALLDLKVVPGGVDDQDVEEEQAKERQNDQDNIGDDRAGVAGFCFLVSHFTAPLFLAWRLV